MGYYWTCPYCGAHNDIGERCDCDEAKREYQEDDFLCSVGAAPAMEPPRPTPAKPEPAYLSIKETADHWGVSYDTVHNLISQGRLEAVKLGGVWRVPRAAIPAYEAANSSLRRTAAKGGRGRPAQRKPVLRL